MHKPSSHGKPLGVRILHWLAVLIFALCLISGYRQADSSWPGTGFFDRGFVNAAHETAGILIALVVFLWAFIRVRNLLRFKQNGLWMMLVSGYHILLVGLGFSIAILGWAGSSAGNYGQALFGVIPMPNIIPSFGAKIAFYLNSLHKELVDYFLILLAIHIVSVVFHMIVLRDQTLSAMWFGRDRKD